ncbi:hypothetical protein PSQ19_08250 [Devosia algicola]|uniref:Uncharacterized protein n=1 Tax=Devosia algicola TaxID=3026418 RepID=A0ABY7YRP2_9HYPH|nr:hypothetical protein [Devosia algicola]WDR03995.1 hypothetical protein PSQ19_08250 [Devosia algicola]
MAISTDYPRPIIVNGYQCRNCDDVAEAKKFIDPAHPDAALSGTDVRQDNLVTDIQNSKSGIEPSQNAVSFGGSLSQRQGDSGRGAVSTPNPPSGLGLVFDKSA